VLRRIFGREREREREEETQGMRKVQTSNESYIMLEVHLWENKTRA
jgi:hypothetical protein